MMWSGRPRRALADRYRRHDLTTEPEAEPALPRSAEDECTLAGAPASGVHVPALDGVRGLAILLVLIVHFQSFSHESWTGGNFIDRAVLRVANVGWIGVDLFFVLSGFLITGIVYDARNGDGYFRNFYARRALRIWPLYYGLLVIVFIVFPLIPRAGLDASLGDQIWYWFYLQNWRPALQPGLVENFFHSATSHFWSLAIEEQFYLVWPAVVLLLSRRKLMLVCAATVAFSFAFRCALRAGGADPELAFRWTPARMDTLAVGALLALAARSPVDWERVLRWRLPVGLAAAALVGVLFVGGRGLNTDDLGVQTAGYTALAMMFGALLVSVVTAGSGAPLKRFFVHNLMTTLGRYSYGLYVVHLPICVFLRWRVDERGGLPLLGGMQLPATIAFFAVAGAASFAIAWLSYNLYERRFLQLKSRFYGSARPPASPGPVPA
jgi:peptidoglycan/LPS O-acetylase OafA/YrhL